MVDNDKEKRIRKLFHKICIVIAFIMSFAAAFGMSADKIIPLIIFWCMLFFMSIVFISVLFEPIHRRIPRTR